MTCKPNFYSSSQDQSGELYYFNFSTGDSVWDHPCDEHFREMAVKERDMFRSLMANAKKQVKEPIKVKDKKVKKDVKVQI